MPGGGRFSSKRFDINAIPGIIHAISGHVLFHRDKD
jgi:hypothetical protein